MEKITEIIAEGVKESSSITIEKDLIIPHMVICSNDKYCSVVQISYEVKVEGVISGCHGNGNAEIKFPITLGAVPLIIDHHQSYSRPGSYQVDFEIPPPYDDNFTIASAHLTELRMII